ncbi:hypothetical protein GG344DRAFT_67813 [Lentinula edodes]|nr:hypothetical protein GG344DRAFT_67813 [Lentinula edodes]
MGCDRSPLGGVAESGGLNSTSTRNRFLPSEIFVTTPLLGPLRAPLSQVMRKEMFWFSSNSGTSWENLTLTVCPETIFLNVAFRMSFLILHAIFGGRIFEGSEPGKETVAVQRALLTSSERDIRFDSWRDVGVGRMMKTDSGRAIRVTHRVGKRSSRNAREGNKSKDEDNEDFKACTRKRKVHGDVGLEGNEQKHKKFGIEGVIFLSNFNKRSVVVDVK